MHAGLMIPDRSLRLVAVNAVLLIAAVPGDLPSTPNVFQPSSAATRPVQLVGGATVGPRPLTTSADLVRERTSRPSRCGFRLGAR